MQPEQFKPFFDKWYRPACANAAKFLWRTDDIEDVVLDAFTATWQNFYRLPLPADAARFLFFILKRRCLNQNRLIDKRKEFFVYAMHTDAEDYNLVEIGNLLTVDLIEKFEAYVAAYCTDRQKEIASLFMLGKNNTEIGAALGINHRTVSAIKLNVISNFKKWITQKPE